MPSFDVISEVDKHELTNAVDTANRELGNRFDFKGSDARFELDDSLVTQFAPSDFQLKQMLDILRGRLAARGIDVRCLEEADPEINLAGARPHLSSPAWVQERDDARLFDGRNLLPVADRDGRRKAIFQWSPGKETAKSGAGLSKMAILAQKPASPFSGILPGTIWVVSDSLGESYYFEFAPDGVLIYEGKRGLRPNGKWRQDDSTISIEINDGVAKLTGTLSGRQMRGDARSTIAGHWTWEAVPR